MNIIEATRSYEDWLAASIAMPLVRSDRDHKHERMADPTNPFPFLRATYYRWSTHWAAAAGTLANAPHVLSVGDLHVENYGTWRDVDGRLCWGVNDFDEADQLSFASDLARLAVSVRFAKKAGVVDVNFGEACSTIVGAYQECLKVGGQPFVLEEHNPALRALAMSAEREPAEFWRKMTKVLNDPEPELPADARTELLASLPASGLRVTLRARPRVGMGSLGRPRYVALTEWTGGWIAREAKTIAPPATAWHSGVATPQRIAEVAARAVRSPDPFYRPTDKWVIRRLAPRCSRIELSSLATSDVGQVLHAMGAEAANVHLGTSGAATAILADLTSRPADWLEEVSRTLSDLTERDWEAWRSTPDK